MFVENIQAYGSTDLTELASLITKYINSGDITLITRVETFESTSADDSIRFYNGDKKIAEFTNMAGTGSFKVELFGNPTNSWAGTGSSNSGVRYIYRMIVCKHGVMFKTSQTSGSTTMKGCIFFTETKNGETGCFVRYASGSSVLYTGYFIAWGDQNPYSTINVDSAAHPSFTGLMSIPTNNSTGNHSVNAYYMPLTQFKTYEGLIMFDNVKYYTDGAIAIKDE